MHRNDHEFGFVDGVNSKLASNIDFETHIKTVALAR